MGLKVWGETAGERISRLLHRLPECGEEMHAQLFLMPDSQAET